MYAVFWKAGQYYDWTDETWETPSAGSDDNAVQAMTESALDGNALSYYATASLDLAKLNNVLASIDVQCRFYLQAGGSSDLTADTVVATNAFSVVAGKQDPVVDIELAVGHRKDETPKVATFWIAVTLDGTPLDLNTLDAVLPGCDVTTYKEGQAAAFFTDTVGAPDAAGRFYLEFYTPGYVGDRTYFVEIDIGSGDLVRWKPFYGAA